MSKILYVSRDLTHMYFHLSYMKHLIKKGNDVHIACLINKDIDDFKKEGIKLHNIDFERKAISMKHKLAYNQIKKLCNLENYDLIHFHTPIAAFIGRFATRKMDTKIVYTAHGLHFYKAAPLLNWIIYYPLERIAARWTDIMILINKEDYNRVKKRFVLRKNAKIYYLNGVGIEHNVFSNRDNSLINKYKKQLNVYDNNLVISCVGELNKNKNQIQLLKAINESKNKNNIKVLIIGEGKEQIELKKYCNEKSLNNIEFLGYRRDIPQLLAISDILVLVSKREGLPKSLMEGMASSLALIGTNTRGIRDLIKEDINGYIVEVDDYINLSKKIDFLYEDEDKLESMKKESYLLSQQYDSKLITEKLDEIYE